MKGINLPVRNSVSYLFNNLKTNSPTQSIFDSLTEYNSIRSGSFYKLAKRYYSKSTDSDTKSKLNDVSQSISTSTADKEKLSKLKENVESLSASVDILTESGSKSVFSKDKDGNYDTEKIYNAVSGFIKNYNSVIKEAKDTDSSSVNTAATNMMNNTVINSKMLASIGITADDNNMLTVNKDTFMKSDMTKVKSLLNDRGSYGYSLSVNSSMIEFSIKSEMNKANTYTNVGNFSNNYKSGLLFNYMI